MRVLFKLAVRHEVRKQLADLDYSFTERRRAIREMTDQVLADAVEQYGKEKVPAEYLGADDGKVQVAPGGGGFLRGLLDWLGSPEGQNFIKFIITLIMALAAA